MLNYDTSNTLHRTTKVLIVVAHARDMIQAAGYVVSAIAWCCIWGQWQRDLLDFTKRDSVNVKLSIKSIVSRKFKEKNLMFGKKFIAAIEVNLFFTRHFILQSKTRRLKFRIRWWRHFSSTFSPFIDSHILHSIAVDSENVQHTLYRSKPSRWSLERNFLRNHIFCTLLIFNFVSFVTRSCWPDTLESTRTLRTFWLLSMRWDVWLSYHARILLKITLISLAPIDDVLKNPTKHLFSAYQ